MNIKFVIPTHDRHEMIRKKTLTFLERHEVPHNSIEEATDLSNVFNSTNLDSNDVDNVLIKIYFSQMNNLIGKDIKFSGVNWTPYSLFARQSLELEYNIARIIENQRKHGFYVNKTKAIQLYFETKTKAEEIAASVHRYFLPRAKLVREITPKYKKDGVMAKTGLVGLSDVAGPFSLIQFK